MSRYASNPLINPTLRLDHRTENEQHSAFTGDILYRLSLGDKPEKLRWRDFIIQHIVAGVGALAAWGPANQFAPAGENSRHGEAKKTVQGKGEEPKLQLIKTNECVTLRPFTLFYVVL